MANLVDEIKNGGKKQDPVTQYVKDVVSGRAGDFGNSYGSETAYNNGYNEFMKMFNVQPNLSGAEKLAVGTVDVGKGFVKPFVSVGKATKHTLWDAFFKKPASSEDQKKLLDIRSKAQELQKQGKISEQTFKNIPAGNLGDAFQYVIDNQNDPAKYTKYLDEIRAKSAKQTRQEVSDSAQVIATLLAPTNILESAAGKTLAPRVLGGIIEGGVYGAANTYADPNATFNDYVKSISENAAFGGAAPVAGSVAGKVLRAPARVAETATGRAVSDAIEPYVSRIDQTGRAVIDRAKSVAMKLPGAEKVASISERLKSQLVDSNSRIYDGIRKLESKGLAPKGTADSLYLKNSFINGNKLANDFIDNNAQIRKLHESIAAIDKKSKVALQTSGEYAAARRDLELARTGRKEFSKAKIASLEEKVATLETKYGKEPLDASYKALVDANAEVSRLLKGTGISEEDFQKMLEQDPNYIRVQREQEKWKLKQAKGQSSTGGTNPLQKLDKKASGEQINPILALHQRVQQVHQFLAANDFKRSIGQTFVKAGEAQAERTTANVTKRKVAAQFLADTKEGKRVAALAVKKNSKKLRIIQAEIDKLNKEGLNVRLRDTGQKTEAPILSGNRDVLKGARTIEGKTTQPLLKSHAVTGTVETHQFSRSMTAKETKDMVANIISQDPKDLAAIRRKLATREPKAAALLSDLTDASDELEAFKTARGAAYQDILSAKDGVHKGKPVLTYWDKGVKNVVSFDSKDAGVVEALKGLDKQQMNAILNATRVLNNVFKYGTTQGNPAFAIPNYIRDQMFSSITSESTWRTHNPIVVARGLLYGIMDGLGVQVKDETWQATKAAIEGGKRIDINRNLKAAAADVLGQIKETRPGLGKVPFVRDVEFKSDARRVFGKVNGLISGLETATRYQNYKGTKALYLAKGATEGVASDRAALAALRNSVDFGASGDLGKVMNTIVPYFNAAIQGPRTLLRAFSERPVTTSAKFAALATPILYATHYNLADPQRAQLYADTPDYVRANNLVFISGNTRFLIPIPKDLAGLYSPIRRAIEASYGFQPASVMDNAKAMIGALTPIQTESGLAAASSVLPGPLKAGLELGANKNFFTGSQIVPDYLKQQNDVPSEQYYRDANGNPKGVSGFTMKLAKALGVSPLQIAHFQQQTMGELGGPVLNNTIDQVSGGTVGGRSIADSVKRRFVYSGSSATTSSFYDVYTPAQNARTAASRQITSLIQQGKRNEAQRRAEEFNNSIEGRFTAFKKLYKDSQFYDPKFDEQIASLKISTSDRSFNARAKKK